MNTTDRNDESTNGAGDSAAKVQALRDMILNAERTIQGAKAMLLQLEGKKKTGRPRKTEYDANEGTVIQGTFDGQFMQGADGKQYPVPANYASKSKLVEGDMLKLTITPDGSFIYKQIGPIERRHVIGIVTQDAHGSFIIAAENRAYRILFASVTYFKLEPGDEVAILLPRDLQATFAAIEHVLQKGALVPEEALTIARETISSGEARMGNWKQEFKPATSAPEPVSATTEGSAVAPVGTSMPATDTQAPDNSSVLEEWIRDMEALEKEIDEQEKVGAKQD
ncbi:MAG: hypothetical protein WCJ25_01680 [Candidatus Moraniibacteriota bacterium]